MIYPKPLRPGDKIRVVGLAGCVKTEDPDATLREAVARITALGFRVELDETTTARWGYLAGTDEQRAAALNNAFADDTVDGVWCLRGGYGCMRILDRIDWQLIRSHPKAFIGYSDITAIHTAMHELCGMCTFHGPMVASDMLSGGTRDSLLDAVCGTPAAEMINLDGSPLRTLRPGIAEGMLVGGNLSLLASTMGTPYALNTKGKLLFIEDVGEEVYIMDRYLQTLRLAGKFDDCAGLILGGFTNVEEGTGYVFKMEQIIDQLVQTLHVPVLAGLQAGHLKEKLTLPLGRRYRLNADNCTLTLID